MVRTPNDWRGSSRRRACAVREVREFYRCVEGRQKRKSANDMSRSNNARTGHDAGAGALHVAYHGSEYVLVFVKLFIASCTPSLYPSPESFTPPNGVSSSR